jgi:hypothetical protein
MIPSDIFNPITYATANLLNGLTFNIIRGNNVVSISPK